MARKRKKKKSGTREGPRQPLGNTVTGDLGPEQLVVIRRSPETNSEQQADFARLAAVRRIQERFI